MTIDTDRAEIIELFGLYADIADSKSFDELPALVHTDPFTLDFESVVGMPPVETPLADYADTLRRTFERFSATHHVITGHVISIDGGRARAHAHVRAEHWVPAAGTGEAAGKWLVVGFYDNEVVRTEQGWRFSRVRLTAAHQENADLLAGDPANS